MLYIVMGMGLIRLFYLVIQRMFIVYYCIAAGFLLEYAPGTTSPGVVSWELISGVGVGSMCQGQHLQE